jgi:hypothetical protein
MKLSFSGVQTLVWQLPRIWQSSETRAMLFPYFFRVIWTCLRAIKDFGCFQIKLWPSVALFIHTFCRGFVALLNGIDLCTPIPSLFLHNYTNQSLFKQSSLSRRLQTATTTNLSKLSRRLQTSCRSSDDYEHCSRLELKALFSFRLGNSQIIYQHSLYPSAILNTVIN